MGPRPYDPGRDREELWRLKRAFERELGAEGEAETRSAYEAKLTEAYRDRYLDWVGRCVAEAPDCVWVTDAENGLAGYAFLLPEALALVWDAAVLNELYVEPDHRGTGLADALFEAVLDVARDQSLPLDRLVLDVAPTNERARAFYDRHGFEPWGELVARGL